MAETYSIKWTNHAPETISNLNRLRCLDAISDVVILCRTEVFRAHKLILSACSEYFESMFVTNPIAIKDPVVIMHQTPPDLFRMVLDFMYTGEVEIPHGALEPFMELAECLLIRGLRSAYQHNTDELPQSPLIQHGTVTGSETTADAGNAAALAAPPSADSPPPSPAPFTPRVEREVAGAPPTPPTPPDNSFESQTKIDFSSRATLRKRTSKSEETEVSKSREAKPKRSKRSRVKTETKEEAVPLCGNMIRSGEEIPADREYGLGAGLDENGEAEQPDNGQGSDGATQATAARIKAELGLELPDNAEPISSMIYRDTAKTSGGPMYACLVCGYRTVSRSYALTHERIHTGERPFPCRVGCGKYFTQTSSRNLHESKRRCVPENSAQDIAQGTA